MVVLRLELASLGVFATSVLSVAACSVTTPDDSGMGGSSGAASGASGAAGSSGGLGSAGSLAGGGSGAGTAP